MAYISILDKVRAKLNKGPAPEDVNSSIKWFRNTIRKLSGFGGSHYSRGGDLRQHLLSDNKRARTRPIPGQMYAFVYSAKWKKILPYWDRFPLVFFIGPNKDGTWSGINLHYLNYNQRYFLFHELLTLADRHPNDPRARLILAYKMLKGMSRFKAFLPCFHKYLPRQIISHLVRIESPDWLTSLFLPVENFAKHSKTYVWNESDRIISGQQKGPTGLPKGSTHTPTVTTSPIQAPVSSNGLPKQS
jgi:hypothetical protein